MSINKSDRKNALLAQKEKLLREIKYCDTRIEDARAPNKSSFDYDSSDSETEFAVTVNNGMSVPQLKRKKSMLKTCLHATQELTNLVILASENNVMVDYPVIDGQCPVTEPGVWREVKADCRIDLVPFHITFYTHKAERDFAPNTYHCLRVQFSKATHEDELSKSVLPALTRPSDAIEVVRSYAAAHRSRRTSLARLAERFAATLYMEPLPRGGYLLKCANLLAVEWALQNRWSPAAPFHHRLVFDIEYMDESYIKRITQVHRQLSDPEVDTDERTVLLSKIISICLEAQGPTQELHDSMSSDPECAQTLSKRRTTLDQEPECPVIKKKKDSEVMAPPKSLPKKTKPKTKGIAADNNKAVKRTSDIDDVGGEKRLKASAKGSEANKQVVKDGAARDNDATGNTVEKSAVVAKNVATTKKSNVNATDNRKSDAVKITNEKDSKGNGKRLKTGDKGDETKQQTLINATEESVAVNEATDNIVKKNIASSKNSATKARVVKPVTKNDADRKKLKSVNKDIENPSKSTSTKKAVTKIAVKTTENVKYVVAEDSTKTLLGVSEGVNKVKNSAGRGDIAGTIEKVASTENRSADTNAGNNIDKLKKITTNTAKVAPKKTISSKIITKDVVKRVVSESNATQKVVKAVKRVASDNLTNPTKQKLEKNVINKKNDRNPTENFSSEKVKNVASKQNFISNPSDPNAEKTKKPINKLTNIKQSVNNNQKMNANPLKTLNKPANKSPVAGDTKITKTGNTEKENTSTKKITSKIPQKKLPSASQGFMKKVPLRISPRKLVAKPKIPSHVSSNTKLETMRKPTTNIPRPSSKPKSTETS